MAARSIFRSVSAALSRSVTARGRMDRARGGRGRRAQIRFGSDVAYLRGAQRRESRLRL